MKRLSFLLCCCALLPSWAVSRADTFGSGDNSFEIEFVTIGDAGNPSDASASGTGAVDYQYGIGKYEISEQMIEKANVLGGLGITIDTRGSDKPATSVTWFEAAQFVNWLNTSKGISPAYKFDDQGDFQLWEPTDSGYDPENLYRNSQAEYVLPSVHEWHKAAYYDPVANYYWDYPTGSDDVPDGIDFVGDLDFEAVFFDGVGSPGPNNINPGPNDITDVGLLSPYGTAGQGGNVTEWEETSWGKGNNAPTLSRGVRGGGWGNIFTHLHAGNRNGIGPFFQSDFFGFRVVQIPEPNTALLLGLAMLVLGGRFAVRSLWQYTQV